MHRIQPTLNISFDKSSSLIPIQIISVVNHESICIAVNLISMISIYDLNQSKTVRNLLLQNTTNINFIGSFDDKIIYACCSDGCIYFWDLYSFSNRDYPISHINCMWNPSYMVWYFNFVGSLKAILAGDSFGSEFLLSGMEDGEILQHDLRNSCRFVKAFSEFHTNDITKVYLILIVNLPFFVRIVKSSITWQSV